MNEIEMLVQKYDSEYYSTYLNEFATFDPERNHLAVRRFLQAYALSGQECEDVWKPIMDKVFVNQELGLPNWMFKEHFNVLPVQGGVLFTDDEFGKLRTIMESTGEKRFAIFENVVATKSDCPPLCLVFPSSITWEEMMRGGTLSSALFGMPAGEFLVFGESGQWGKYSDNDAKHPLDIWGYASELAKDFHDAFFPDPDEIKKIIDWIPPIYRKCFAKDQPEQGD